MIALADASGKHINDSHGSAPATCQDRHQFANVAFATTGTPFAGWWRPIFSRSATSTAAGFPSRPSPRRHFIRPPARRLLWVVRGQRSAQMLLGNLTLHAWVSEHPSVNPPENRWVRYQWWQEFSVSTKAALRLNEAGQHHSPTRPTRRPSTFQKWTRHGFTGTGDVTPSTFMPSSLQPRAPVNTAPQRNAAVVAWHPRPTSTIRPTPSGRQRQHAEHEQANNSVLARQRARYACMGSADGMKHSTLHLCQLYTEMRPTRSG